MILSEKSISKIIRMLMVEIQTAQIGSTRTNALTNSDNSLTPAWGEVEHAAGPVKIDKLQRLFSVNKTEDVDLENLNEPTQTVIIRMFELADEYNSRMGTIITSGARTDLDQAGIMWDNWHSNGNSTPGGDGKMTKGTQWLADLYADDSIAVAIGEIFDKKGMTKNTGIPKAAKILKDRGPISNHSRGSTFDVRATSTILKILKKLESEDLIIFHDEKNKKNPHYHVEAQGGYEFSSDVHALIALDIEESKGSFYALNNKDEASETSIAINLAASGKVRCKRTDAKDTPRDTAPDCVTFYRYRYKDDENTIFDFLQRVKEPTTILIGRFPKKNIKGKEFEELETVSNKLYDVVLGKINAIKIK